jgi:hypothetical protein
MQRCKACDGPTRGLYCDGCNKAAREDPHGGFHAQTFISGGERPYTGARKRATAHRTPGPRVEGLDELRLTLYGAPRTKKTHNRLVRHGGRHKVLPSAQWTAWRDALAASGQVQPWMRLRDQSYNCAALFYRDRASGDATGYMQGLADVLEYLGVVSNDRLLVSWNGSELMKDANRPRVEIHLTPATGDR